MEAWTDFFVAEVGAAAALAGLLVVAMSINVEKILALPNLPTRASQTLLVIGAALILASFGLFPGMEPRLFGWIALVIGAFLIVYGIAGFLRTRRSAAAGDRLMWSLSQLVAVLVAALPMAVGGCLAVTGHDIGLGWIATAIVLSFVTTLQGGWVLMIEILR